MRQSLHHPCFFFSFSLWSTLHSRAATVCLSWRLAFEASNWFPSLKQPVSWQFTTMQSGSKWMEAPRSKSLFGLVLSRRPVSARSTWSHRKWAYKHPLWSVYRSFQSSQTVAWPCRMPPCHRSPSGSPSHIAEASWRLQSRWRSCHRRSALAATNS